MTVYLSVAIARTTAIAIKKNKKGAGPIDDLQKS